MDITVTSYMTLPIVVLYIGPFDSYSFSLPSIIWHCLHHTSPKLCLFSLLGDLRMYYYFSLLHSSILIRVPHHPLLPFGQLRGSVPLYWSQRPNLRYKPKVLLGGSQLSFFSGASDLGFGPGVRIDEAGLANVQSAITRTHFNHLVYTYGYGRQIVVNLLDQKGLERPLNRAYATATTDLDENEVK